MRTILFSTLLIILTTFVEVSICEENKNNNRFGGFARWYSMGSNPFIIDLENIKYNFAYSSVYSSCIWGDIGYKKDTFLTYNNSHQFMGINIELSNEFNIGLLFNRLDFISYEHSIGLISDEAIYEINSAIDKYYQSNPDKFKFMLDYIKNNTTVFGSYKLENFIFGFGVSYCGTSSEYENNKFKSKTEASQYGINLSGIGNISSNLKFDASLSLTLPSAEHNSSFDGKTKLRSDASITNISLNARTFIKLNEKFEFIPLLTIFSSSLESKTFDDITNKENSHSGELTRIVLRGGIKYQTENLLVALGPGLIFDNNTPGGSTIKFPEWSIGAEFDLTQWMTIRTGYTFSKIYSDDNNFKKTYFNEGDLRMGIGFRFGKFNLEASIDEDIIRQGLKLIGGNDDTFAYVSMSYEF